MGNIALDPLAIHPCNPPQIAARPDQDRDAVTLKIQ